MKIWSFYSIILSFIYPALAQNDEDGDRMSFIGTSLEAFNPCPDGFIGMEREIGRRPSEENYWEGRFYIDEYKNLSEARITMTLDNPAVLTVDPEVARVYAEGLLYRITPFDAKDSIKFTVKAPQGKPFPNIVNATLNSKSVCKNPSKWTPTFLYSKPIALGSVTPAPSDFAPYCGRKQIEHAELIVRGSESKYGDWPWHAGLFLTNFNRTYICGGTLISRTNIITAAHCVTINGQPRSISSLTVTLGKYRLKSNELATQDRRVSSIVVHEQFTYGNLRNDIAIIKFDEPVDFNEYIQPICLWPDDDKAKETVFGSEATLVGWGLTDNETLSDTLRVGNMSIVSDTECLLSYASFFQRYVYEGSLCAGQRNMEGSSACNGDSGGGLIIPKLQPDGKLSYFLRGIVSLSVSLVTGRCDSRYYAVFTDSAQYGSWITRNK